MRALQSFTINFFNHLRHTERVHGDFQHSHGALGWPTRNTTHNVLGDALLAPTAAIVVKEFLLVAVP